jgi:bacterioferritin-associated ferredoxin
MIVCLCRGVSDGRIRALIAAGVRTRTEVRQACGAGSDCGKCRAMLADLLEDARGTDYRGMTMSPDIPAGGLP